MKKILITGANSFIGGSVRRELEKEPEKYQVDVLSVRNQLWEEYDFSSYDVVYHVAAIVHLNEKRENENLYREINMELPYKIARKAKESGVKQFIFMSSMSVYGLDVCTELITKDTVCHPVTIYGKSKYKAELLLQELLDESFKVCIIRAPMVYGENAPGNLEKLVKLVKVIRVFPTIRNERSVITIDRFVEFIKRYIDNEISGIILPQNEEYMCTYEYIKDYMAQNKIKVYYTSMFNWIIQRLIGKVRLITKCFGDLRYEK